MLDDEVRILSDAPAEVDSFGSHQRLADAITQLIHSDKDAGKAIALTSPWGSGKSSVVQMIKTGLERNDPDTRVFVFDAWAHQGDPLGRCHFWRRCGIRSRLERIAARAGSMPATGRRSSIS